MAMDTNNNFRYERKFVTDQLDAFQVQSFVKRHPAMFFEAYPPRYVNNFYLDSSDLSNYHDNIYGYSERRKVRLRWYGILFGLVEKPVLELKIKKGLVGTKRHYSFPPLHVGASFNHASLKKNVENADIPSEVDLLLKSMKVVLMNRYLRRYYETRDKRFRITIDSELSYYGVNALSNSFIRKQIDASKIIVECKYNVDDDVLADRISGFFPFQMTKSSKYVRGIELVYY